MKLLDDKQRLFGIANPIDALIIVAVLIGIVVVANVLFGVNTSTITRGHGTKTVEMTVKASGITAWSPGYLAVGDKIIKIGGAGTIGTVSAFRAEPAVDEVTDATGNYHVVQSKQTTDVYITIRGTGDITQDGVFVGDEQVRVNQPIDIAAPRFQAERCRVLSLQVVQQ